MRTCPHCGSELHDDSTFCFACMSIVNERKELLIKVNTSRKRTIPMVCVAVAIIAASSVFAVVSKKNNAVETKTPEPAKADDGIRVLSEDTKKAADPYGPTAFFAIS